MDFLNQNENYLMNTMENLELRGDSYTDPPTLYSICGQPSGLDTINRDLSELLRRGELYMDETHLYVPKILKAEKATATYLAKFLESNSFRKTKPMTSRGFGNDGFCAE